VKSKNLFFAAAGLFLLGAFANCGSLLELLRSSGVKGGLVVCVGSPGAGELAQLRSNESYIVQCLERDSGKVAQLRASLRSLQPGLYGPVSVQCLEDSYLPYAENLVNLLIVMDRNRLSLNECLRVLVPGGVLFLREGTGWKKIAKPWPEGIDQWTHGFHDPGGNPVARDSVVGPPRRLQWTCGPKWARSHGWTPSVSAMVSSAGRLFYVCDETLTGVDGSVPSKWFLVARDAFNGVLLWKRRVPNWGSKVISGTPGTGNGITVGRFTMPPHICKRLVATGDTVYVTLGARAPVTALWAESGEPKRTYKGSEGADEFVVLEGKLVVAINPPPEKKPPRVPALSTPPPAPPKHVCAFEASSGRLLWKQGPFKGIRASRGQDPFGRLELAAGGGKVFVLTDEAIWCLDLASGAVRWKIDRPLLPAGAVRRLGFAGMYEYKLAVMVYYKGVVLLAQPEPNIHHTYHTMPGTLYAFSAQDGRLLWKHPYGGWGHCTQPGVFAIGDTVWTHVHVPTEYGRVWGNGYRAKDPSKVEYRIQGLDLLTGKLVAQRLTKTIFNVGHHHRCCRNRSTVRYLLSSRRGVEFVDLSTGENFQNHWVRSGCQVGYLPCNGLLYVAPHPCACYIQAKLTGFNALAPKAEARLRKTQRRLRKGPAYGSVKRAPVEQKRKEWPTYRHDNRRSGATEEQIGAKLKEAWRSTIGGRPSSLTVAGGRVLASEIEGHTVYALSSRNGKILWSFTAGGRVDSPPTAAGEVAVFGCADGKVYCLRLSDGSLCWSFEAAPYRRFVVAEDQLESAWPVCGSVLVKDGLCFFAAGRSSYLDGGIYAYTLDLATGKVIEERRICHADPQTGKQPASPSPNYIPGLLNDIPVAGRRAVYIRQLAVWPVEARTGTHLYSTAGFLDDSLFNRTFWRYGSASTSGLMVLGEKEVYGFELYPSRGADTVFKPGDKAYRVVCIPLKAGKRTGAARRRRRRQAARWTKHLPIRVTALLRAGDLLFAAGPPDVVDPADPHGAWEGRKGGVLAVLKASDGKIVSTYKLPYPPVWDGMAASGGRLYLALSDGTILCMQKART